MTAMKTNGRYYEGQGEENMSETSEIASDADILDIEALPMLDDTRALIARIRWEHKEVLRLESLQN